MSLSKFLPQETSLYSLQGQFSTLAADWNPRRAFQKEDLFTVTLHWWVDRQSCLVVAGPCVLQEPRYLGTAMHQKGSLRTQGA